MSKQAVQMTVRIPVAVKAWLDEQVNRYHSSQSSEITRALLHHIEREDQGGRQEVAQ